MKLRVEGINFRDYQNETHQVLSHLFFNEHEKRLLAILATGLGKTENIIKFVADHYDLEQQRVLILAQSQELIYQMHKRFLLRAPELQQGLRVPPGSPVIGIEMGSQNDSPDARIMIATRQTLARDEGSRLKDVLSYGAFDLWVIDEADLSVTTEYELIHSLLVEANPEVKCLGLTATGERSDGLSLGIRFDKIAISKDVRYGVANGWLRPVKGYIVDTPLPNLELADAELVHNWMDIHYEYWNRFDGPNRHTLHFFHDLEMARRYCRFMQEKGFPSVHVDSFMCIDLSGKSAADYPALSYDRHREMVLEQLQSDAIYATNKFVLQRGFDWRKCNMLMKSSRMGSDATFTQAVGRGTRLPPGVFNLICTKDKKDEEREYRVVYESGETTSSRLVSELEFKPETILLDFLPSESTLVTVGHLFGDTQIPQRVELVEEEEDEEPQPEQLEFPQSVRVTNTRIREKKMWGNSDTYWYQDIENECSTGFGQDIPHMIYISAPKHALSANIYGKLMQLTDKLDDLSDPMRIQALRQVYHLTSHWMVWVLSAEKLTWGMQWVHAHPCNLLYEQVQSSYSSLHHAQHAAGSLSNFMIRHMRDDLGLVVDIRTLDKFSKNETLPSEKQLLKLRTVVKSVFDAGWRSAYIEQPKNIFEASNAINHCLAKVLVLNTLKDILKGEMQMPAFKV